MDGVLANEYMPAVPNLLKLKHQSELDKKVSVLSLIRMIELCVAQLPKVFDLSTLKNIHRYIFQDVFEQEEIEENIKNGIEDVIQGLNGFDWVHKNSAEMSMKLADFLFDITRLRPFIKGTYQATMIYLSMFVKSLGLCIDDEYIFSHSILISRYLTLDDAFIKERVALIIQGAMEIALSKANTHEAVTKVIEESGYKPTDELINNIKKLNQRLCKIHTIKQVYDLYKFPDLLGKEEQKIIIEIADGFKAQETLYYKPLYITKCEDPEYNKNL